MRWYCDERWLAGHAMYRGETARHIELKIAWGTEVEVSCSSFIQRLPKTVTTTTKRIFASTSSSQMKNHRAGVTSAFRLSVWCLTRIKIEWLGYRIVWWRNCANMLSHFHRIPERDRQTDRERERGTNRQTDTITISLSRISMLTCDKNRKLCLLA